MSGQIYYVRAQDGNRYGPADLETLNAWAAEGRINAATMIEIEGSAAPGFPFGSLPGAMVPGGVAPAPAEPASAPMGPAGGAYGGEEEKPWTPDQPAAPSPYANPQPAPNYPAADPGAYSAAYTRSSGAASDSNAVTISIILSVVGIVCCGLAAPFGLWMGIKAKKDDLPNAQAAVVVGWISVVLMVLQIIGSIVYFALAGAVLANGSL
jgi:hypothetical protein